ncbi:hypothetical protein Tco_0859190 [Tanacetum coccineum]|uniref:Uncharacterized protein n=1 Tax=Tanacetum coccineum TaxID=301880 RepID=A0ABQ5BE89_9ASTR
MMMEHKDAQGHSMFTSRAWRRLFDIKGPLVHELILEFFSMFRFGEAVLELDTARALQFQLGGVRRRMSCREFILALGLHSAKEMQTAGFGLYWILSAYTLIRDPMLRLCYRLIACSIAGRSQAPEKLTVTELFYLRGMDVGSFVARLAEHFGLLTKERLQGLTMIVRDLPVIDMAELEGDTGGVAEEAPVAPEGGDEDEEMPQAVSPSPKTQGKRIARLKEEVHGMREALQGHREVLDSMTSDFSRDAPGRGLARPALPQLRSSQTHDPSIPHLLILSSVHLYYSYHNVPKLKTAYLLTYILWYDDFDLFMHDRIKPGSKFSTIVREYVTEPSTLSKSKAKLRRESDFKCVKAEEKSNLKTSL